MSTPFNITSDFLIKGGRRPIHAGDDYDYTFNVKRAGSWLSLASATIWFTLKEDTTDSDSEAKLQYVSDAPGTDIEITGPTTGAFILHLHAADTAELEGTWHYDIKAKLSTTKIIRIAWGKFEFLPNVTQAQ
jgi:hypothetical protein